VHVFQSAPRQVIPCDVLELAERWLKLLSDLGRALATLAAYRSTLHHHFSFCSQRRIEPEKAWIADLTTYISLHLPGCLFLQLSAKLKLRLSEIRLWYDFPHVLRSLYCQSIVPLRHAWHAEIRPRTGGPVVNLPRIPDDAQWQSFLSHAADYLIQ
jgi:integrase/recombinase XerD